MKEYVLKHRKLFSIGMILIGCVAIIFPYFFTHGNDKGINSELEIVYFMSQVVSSLFVITGVVIAGWQYYLASHAELTKLQLVYYLLNKWTKYPRHGIMNPDNFGGQYYGKKCIIYRTYKS